MQLDGLLLAETPAICAIDKNEILILGGWTDEGPSEDACVYDTKAGIITNKRSGLGVKMTCWCVPMKLSPGSAASIV